MSSISIGETIRAARVDHKLKLRELARTLGVSPTHLSDIENGRRTPSEVLLKEIVERLELDLDQMLAAAGRVPEEARLFIENNPKAIPLFRKVSSLNEEQLSVLEEQLRVLEERLGQQES